MIVLDTDHVTLLRYPESAGHAQLVRRMRVAGDDLFATTIVTVEEQMRGWLAVIARVREVPKQVAAYERLGQMLTFFAAWECLPFDAAAAGVFVGLRQHRLRVGTQDLKIAATVLSRGALLLSANAKDFGLVPGLRVENWLR